MAKGGGGIQIAFDAGDMRSLRELVTGDQLYGNVWRAGMKHLQIAGGLAARRGAPVRTGKLRESIHTAIARGPFPRWVAVRVRARRRGTKGTRAEYRNFPYGRLLAFSVKWHHRDWLLRAVWPAWGGIGHILGKMGAEIEQRWRSR